MWEEHQINGDWYRLAHTTTEIRLSQESSLFAMQIRQYKKDFDNSRKNLHKAEENYALEKNKEMLIGA